MPYSSKKQEQFYQPHRIVVCMDSDNWRHNTYAVYRIDVTKRYPEEGFIVATWIPRWRKGASRWEEGGRHYRAHCDSKKQAQDTAKEQAVLLSLPYSIKDDYYESYRKLIGVQETKCVICGKNIGYQAAPDACDDCRLDAERGKLLESERGIYNVEAKGLASGHCGYDYSLPLARAFYKVVGDVPEGKSTGRFGSHTLYRRSGKALSTIAKGHSDSSGGVNVSMTAAQAEALQEIVDIIEQIDQTAFAQGKREGSNILNRLVAGELPSNAFEKERFKE